MELIAAAASDVGLDRSNNEDYYYCGGTLFAIADGMGGHAAGEIASALAISILRRNRDNLQRAFDAAHTHLIFDAQKHPERRGMGTTMTALRFDEPWTVTIAHVGDSACYLLRGGHAEKITKDQSVRGNILLNCLGSKADAYSGAVIETRNTKPLDVYVLCSDGLSNYLEDTQMLMQLMITAGDPLKLPQGCVDYALRRGGSDNVTVVAVGIIQ